MGKAYINTNKINETIKSGDSLCTLNNNNNNNHTRDNYTTTTTTTTNGSEECPDAGARVREGRSESYNISSLLKDTEKVVTNGLDRIALSVRADVQGGVGVKEEVVVVKKESCHNNHTIQNLKLERDSSSGAFSSINTNNLNTQATPSYPLNLNGDSNLPDNLTQSHEIAGNNQHLVQMRGKGRPAKNGAQAMGGLVGRAIIKCLVCAKVFNNSSALAKHKLTHSDERRYTCSLCSKAFKRQDHLNGHMMTHSSKKPFECKFANCCKSYCDARSLKRHLENFHHDCIKSFHEAPPPLHAPETTSAATDPHLEATEAESADVWAPGFNPLDEPKPIKCLVCHRGFRNVPALNGHMRLHGGYTNRDSLDERSFKSGDEEGSEVGSDQLDEACRPPASSSAALAGRQEDNKPSWSTDRSIPTSMSYFKGDDEEGMVGGRLSYEEMLRRKEFDMQNLKIRDAEETFERNFNQNLNQLLTKIITKSSQNLNSSNHLNEDVMCGRTDSRLQVHNWGMHEDAKNIDLSSDDNSLLATNGSKLSDCLQESLLYRRRLRKNSEKSGTAAERCQEDLLQGECGKRSVASSVQHSGHQTFPSFYQSSTTCERVETEVRGVNGALEGGNAGVINLSRYQGDEGCRRKQLDHCGDSNSSTLTMASLPQDDSTTAPPSNLDLQCPGAVAHHDAVKSSNPQTHHSIAFQNNKPFQFSFQRPKGFSDDKLRTKRIDTSRCDIKVDPDRVQADQKNARRLSIPGYAAFVSSEPCHSEATLKTISTCSSVIAQGSKQPLEGTRTECRQSTSSLPCTPFTAHTPYTPRTSGAHSPRQANHFEFPPVSSPDASEAVIPSLRQSASTAHLSHQSTPHTLSTAANAASEHIDTSEALNTYKDEGKSVVGSDLNQCFRGNNDYELSGSSMSKKKNVASHGTEEISHEDDRHDDSMPVLMRQLDCRASFTEPQCPLDLVSSKQTQASTSELCTPLKTTNHYTPSKQHTTTERLTVAYTPPPMLSPYHNKLSTHSSTHPGNFHTEHLNERRDQVSGTASTPGDVRLNNKKGVTRGKAARSQVGCSAVHSSKPSEPHTNIGEGYQALIPALQGGGCRGEGRAVPLQPASEAAWSGEEEGLFQEALMTCNKDFHAIAQKVGSRTTQQCIRFYYAWKKLQPAKYQAFKLARCSRSCILRSDKSNTL